MKDHSSCIQRFEHFQHDFFLDEFQFKKNQILRIASNKQKIHISLNYRFTRAKLNLRTFIVQLYKASQFSRSETNITRSTIQLNFHCTWDGDIIIHFVRIQYRICIEFFSLPRTKSICTRYLFHIKHLGLPWDISWLLYDYTIT